MIYTIPEIAAAVLPITSKHGIRSVYLFGSYARNEATEMSDVDLLIDTDGTQLKGLFALGALYCELEEALQKRIDLITLNSLEQKALMPVNEVFRENVLRERILLFNLVPVP